MNDLYFCKDLSEKFDIKLDCCDSCHDDFDEGYSSLCEREIDGIIYQVCCRMLQKYDEKHGKG